MGSRTVDFVDMHKFVREGSRSQKEVILEINRITLENDKGGRTRFFETDIYTEYTFEGKVCRDRKVKSTMYDLFAKAFRAALPYWKGEIDPKEVKVASQEQLYHQGVP